MIQASQVVLVVKNLPADAGDVRNTGLISGSRRSPGEGWQPTPAFFPGKSHGRKSLAGYSPWGRKESDTTEAKHAQVGTKVAERLLVQSLFFQLCCKEKMISWGWEVLGVHTARASLCPLGNSPTCWACVTSVLTLADLR